MRAPDKEAARGFAGSGRQPRLSCAWPTSGAKPETTPYSPSSTATPSITMPGPRPLPSGSRYALGTLLPCAPLLLPARGALQPDRPERHLGPDRRGHPGRSDFTYAIARLGVNLAGYRAGLCAGLLAALYWPAIYFEGELLTVGLECLLEVVLILALWVATTRRNFVAPACSWPEWSGACVPSPGPTSSFLPRPLWPGSSSRSPAAAMAARKWQGHWCWFFSAPPLVIAPGHPAERLGKRRTDPPDLQRRGQFLHRQQSRIPMESAAVLPGGRRSLRGGYRGRPTNPPGGDSVAPWSHGEISDYWYAKGLAWMKNSPQDFARTLGA